MNEKIKLRGARTIQRVNAKTNDGNKTNLEQQQSRLVHVQKAMKNVCCIKFKSGLKFVVFILKVHCE